MLKDKYNLWGGYYVIIDNIYIDIRTIVCYSYNKLNNFLKITYTSGEIMLFHFGSNKELSYYLNLL